MINYEDFVSFYFILAEISYSVEFPVYIRGNNTLNEFFYKFVGRLVFPSLKDDKWLVIERECKDHEQELTLCFLLARFFYNTCRVEKLRKENIKFISKGNQDYSYRFIFYLVERETYQGPLFMIMGLIHLIRTWNYELPFYSNK